MSCHYQEWDKARHEMGYCGAESVSDGLCQEHLEWVADCRAPAVSKLDMKYPYRLPRRKAVKLGASAVVETILEPSALTQEYADYVKREGEKANTFVFWFAHNIRPTTKAPKWTEDCIDQIRKPTEAEKQTASSAMDKLCAAIEAEAPEMVKAGRFVVGTIPDNRPIGKRAAKIDRTIDRMTALC